MLNHRNVSKRSNKRQEREQGWGYRMTFIALMIRKRYHDRNQRTATRPVSRKYPILLLVYPYSSANGFLFVGGT